MKNKIIQMGITGRLIMPDEDSVVKITTKVGPDNPYGISYLDNKFAILNKLPLSFESYEAVESYDSIEASKKFDVWLKVNHDYKEKFANVIFDPEKEYKITEIKLRKWCHLKPLKNIKNQQQLDKYLKWLYSNNELIAKQYPELLQELKEEFLLEEQLIKTN